MARAGKWVIRLGDDAGYEPGTGGWWELFKWPGHTPPPPCPLRPSMIYIKTISDKVLTSRARGMETFKSRYPSNEVTGN